MDNKFTISQEAHDSISEAMSLVTKKLQETPSERFERSFRELIQKEIATGESAATNFKFLIPGSHEYTYTNSFPLAIYEALTEETLLMLEKSNIYLTKNDFLGKANIRIVFHF